MTFEKIQSKSKIYNTYILDNNDAILFIGKTQEGNDYLISNVVRILAESFNTETTEEQLIWMHGHGAGPHFILYKNDEIKLDAQRIEHFIKSLCPIKSMVDMPFICGLLSDVKKTNIKGMVILVKKYKLTNLLLMND